MNHSPQEMSLLLTTGIFFPSVRERGRWASTSVPRGSVCDEIRLMIFSFWVTSRLILLIPFSLAPLIALFIAHTLDYAAKNPITWTHTLPQIATVGRKRIKSCFQVEKADNKQDSWQTAGSTSGQLSVFIYDDQDVIFSKPLSARSVFIFIESADESCVEGGLN